MAIGRKRESGYLSTSFFSPLRFIPLSLSSTNQPPIHGEVGKPWDEERIRKMEGKVTNGGKEGRKVPGAKKKLNEEETTLSFPTFDKCTFFPIDDVSHDGDQGRRRRRLRRRRGTC